MSPQTHPGVFVRRDKNENCYYMQKEYISRLHTMFNNDLLNTNTTIKIIDSHSAYPYYEKSKNEIVFDTHFLDILRVVTAIMISEDENASIDELADACSADYFLCKDEIYLALKYAESFSKKKCGIEQLISERVQEINSGYDIVQDIFSYAESLIEKYNILYARFCDRLFAVEHPTEHALYCPCGSDEYNKLYDKVCSNLLIDLNLNI